MRFTQEFIEQVRQANDIVSVISSYVPLKRRGRSFWACCPFHNEKTASFTVTPEKGFFYCFGCHAHGDIFSFIMKKENLTFAEAVQRLAERANIPLPAVERSKEDLAREKRRARLYEINELAGNFFHNCLTKTRYGVSGLSYFHRRHLTDDTIRSFKLGFAPDSWTKLVDAFARRGISGAELVTVGLARKKGDHYYDAFRNRVIFPIHDGRGRIVGFGGRVLDDSKPKYLNSPETEIFNKRHLLFAMDKAHSAIFQKKKAILVEGYMDVISAHNRGISNVVASLGTAFTPDQARLLQRQAKELILSYDMDSAGREATLRAMEIVRGLGMNIRVVSLPQGKDPDEYINTQGPEKFQEAIDNAPNVLDYMLMTALQHHDETTLEGKAAITAAVMPVVAQIDNRVVLEGFLRKMAERLHISDGAVQEEFNRYVSAHPEANQREVTISASVRTNNAAARGNGANAVSEENILRYLVEHPEFSSRSKELIEPTYFTHPIRRSLYEKLLALYDDVGPYALSGLEGRLTSDEAGELSRIMVLQDVPIDESVLLDYVKHFQLSRLQEEYKKCIAQAGKYSKANDPRLADALNKGKSILEEMKKWS